MAFERSKELSPKGEKSTTEHAKNAVSDIGKITAVDIDKTFPRMKELMNSPSGAETFSQISNLSQVCKWQNDAIDRKKMRNMCEAMDSETHS